MCICYFWTTSATTTTNKSMQILYKTDGGRDLYIWSWSCLLLYLYPIPPVFLYGWMNEWEHILFLEEYKSKRDKFMDGRCGLSDDHFWLLTKLVRREVSTCSSCSKRQLQISLESRYRFWRERVGWMYE